MNDPKNTVVRYVRYNFTGEPIGCVVAIKTPDGIKYGWSQCNKVDNFNKRTGRNIAIQRALFPPNVEIKPALVKVDLFSPFTGKVVQTSKLDFMGMALEDIQRFAENVAFATKPKRPEASELPEGLVFNADKTMILNAITGETVARIVDSNVPVSIAESDSFSLNSEDIQGVPFDPADEWQDEDCDGNCGDRNCPHR